MKKISLLLIVVIAALFHSCQDDIIGEGDTREIIQEPTITVQSAVSGIVTNPAGMPLENTEVSYNNRSYFTDENGYFKIENIIAGENGGILSFNKMDYFKNYKFFMPSPDTESFMRVHLVERQLSGLVSGSHGGQIDLGNGAVINFSENSFVDENNVSYEGDVSVYAHWFDPADSRSFSPSMPGDLRALDAEGQLAQLSTYGMMAVELYTDNGRELQLAENKKARLEFPIPNSLINAAPEVIETWSLNEQTVYWEEEDIASLVDGKYIAEVSHFSFWNCDVPFPLVNISGKIVDLNGSPLPGLRMCIIAFNGSQTGYGWTDGSGGFRGKVPKNQELVLQIKDECGNVVFDQTIGPFSTDASFGEIQVNIQDKVTVSGRLVCNGMGISSGYARINLNNLLFYIADVDADGFFTLPILECQLSQLTIQGFDLENARVSDEIAFNVTGPELDAGEIEVCEQLEEYIIYKIDGSQELLLEDPAAYIIDDNLVIQSFSDSIESGIEMTVENITTGTIDEILSINAMLFEPGSNRFLRFVCGSDNSTECENSQVVITELGIEGEFVTGSFMAENSSPNSSGNSIMGEFRIKIEQITESRSISGIAWIDVNQDGIKQPIEPYLPNVRMTLVNTSNNQTFTAITQITGYYGFENLIPGEYRLTANPSNGYSFTLVDQGNSDVNDSDIGEQGLSVTLVDMDLTNINVGFITNGTMACDVEFVSNPSCFDPEGGSVILYLNGVPPYQISVNGQTYGILNVTELLIENLSEGPQFIEAIDDVGNICERQFSLNSDDGISCRVITEAASCGANDGVAFVEVEGPSANYTYEWSNGATTQTVNNLPEGSIWVTVTDENGCQTQCEGFIWSAELELFVDITNTLCEDGQVEYLLVANVEGAEGNIDFNWSTGSNDQAITVTEQDQFYTVSVSDLATNCFAETEVYIGLAESEITGMVWNDDTGMIPDINEPNEMGVDSIQVELYNASNLNQPILATLTNEEGFYLFNRITAGDYVVKFILRENASFVNQDAGMDDLIDSDADPLTGFTDVITIEGCDPKFNIDAGFSFE